MRGEPVRGGFPEPGFDALIAVHVASRVLSTAAPGEILVSGTVRDLLLGSDVKFEDRGRHHLKGVEGDWQLFALKDEPAASGSGRPRHTPAAA
jgi:class 3 adenylate cyclase